MNAYTEIVTITVVASLSGIASGIARALDPDVGGANSFHLNEGADFISVTTPCTQETLELMRYLQGNPAALHELVLRDYAYRWSHLIPPTLSECENFCAAITITSP